VDIIAMAAASGHQAVYIDLQHSPLSLETTSQLCVAGLAMGVTPLVRVPSADPGTIQRVLDGGAQGIIVPDVRTVAAAEALARCCHFPPWGTRSVFDVPPQTGFRAMPLPEQSRQLDEATMFIPMIETPEAVEVVDGIVGTKGVDAIFVGTYDLAQAMGLPGELEHPRVREAYQKMLAACLKHRKALLIGGLKEPAALAEYVAQGAARCYFTGSDAGFMLAGARQKIASICAAEPSLRG
jgi:2-keto-3-deoxy-L-rhamnonate aldolase RhmA